MNEFSFITYSATITDECNLALPIKLDTDLAFYTSQGTTVSTITVVDKTGLIELSTGLEFDVIEDVYVKLKGDFTADLTEFKCFRLKINFEGDVFYSNLLRYEPNSETTLLKYLCYEPQFGFDYSIANSYNQVRLPIIIKQPQFPQEDKVYIDGNGVRRLLFSKIDAEYELETEYMPVEWHEKLVVALGHDEVYYDGVRYQKSSPYEIDYEEYDELPCGTRLYKASAKATKNTTIRNNNC